MKKVVLFIVCIFMAVNLLAQNEWTVQSVPNTRLQSNEIHVSDPDGYLSDSVEMTINRALCAIRDTADVFVVTLTSIGDSDPKHFATQLFNYWGIGDAGKDNGVLLLFVENQHALEFETGYGAEATLTDAKCERIFTRTIVPYFRAGDYEGGLCAGVTEIVSVYGGEIPTGLMTFMPSTTESDSAESDIDDVPLFAIFVFLLMMVMPVVALVYWVNKRSKITMATDTFKLKTEDGITYLEDSQTAWSGSPWEGKGCLGALMLGFSLVLFLFIGIFIMTKAFPEMSEWSMFNGSSLIALFLYLTWMCFRQGQRTLKTADSLAKLSVNPNVIYKAAFDHTANKIAFWMAPWLGWLYHKKLKSRMENCSDCQCPTCHERMSKDSGFVLPEIHALESRIGALNFRPYRCHQGHTIVVKEHGRQYSQFCTCGKCGGFTMKKTHTETVRAADYSRSGEKQETYVCQNCGETLTKTVVIPKLVHHSSSSSSSSSSSRSYSSHSSSRSSGGSFGGGRSGGGGYSGRW